MLTPDDIRNEARASGYERVRKIGGQPSRAGLRTYYQAELWITEEGTRRHWHGPARPTARAAAQDYCDYVNDMALVQPTLPRDYPTYNFPPPTHIKDAPLKVRTPRNLDAPGFIYAAIEDVDYEAVTIGFTRNLAKRLHALNSKSRRPIAYIGWRKGTWREELEFHAAQKGGPDHIRSEWYNLTDPIISFVNH